MHPFYKNIYAFCDYSIMLNKLHKCIIFLLINSGNTEIKAKHGEYNRISVVCYLREGMLKWTGSSIASLLCRLYFPGNEYCLLED